MSSVNWEEKYLLCRIVAFSKTVCEEFHIQSWSCNVYNSHCQMWSQISEENGNGLLISLFHQISQNVENAESSTIWNSTPEGYD